MSFAPGSFLLSILINGGSSAAAALPNGSTMKVVWIANHDRPVSDGSSLQLAPDGNLILWDVDGNVAWSTRTSSVGVSALQLDSSGSLELINSTNASIWQSFDSPSDCLLLGQTFRYQQKLVSMHPGRESAVVQRSYTLLMDASGMALYASLPDPQVYWVWGYFGNDTFSITHTCNRLMAAKLELVNKSSLNLLMLQSDTFSSDTAGNNYSAFCNLLKASTDQSQGHQLALDSLQDGQNSDLVFLRLTDDGNLEAHAYANLTGWYTLWELYSSPTNSCLLPDYCGTYGVCSEPGICSGCTIGDNGATLRSSQSGCSATHKPSCNSNSTVNSSSWEMLSSSGIDYFAIDYADPTANLSSKEACAQLCMENCSCAAAFYHANTGSCFLLDQLEGSLRNVSDPNKVAFLKFDARDLIFPAQNSSGRSGRSLFIGLVVAISGSTVLVLIGVLTLLITGRKLANANLKYTDGQEDTEGFDFSGMTRRYSFKDLEKATQGFTEELGRGGFGVVYKGILQDGRAVAVKQLQGALQGHKEFHAEVATLGSIHHWHLVQLYGFCAEGSHRLLVYEYMANGSLARWLFSPNNLPILSWEQRRSIALGVARGLSYLHSECKEKIIHFDVKPQNVLLDESFVAKLADFGLSRLVSRDQRGVVTTMRGTPGYVAPEWLLDSAITEKSDVYSFGMVLLELVSGKKNHYRGNSAQNEGLYYVPAKALRMVHEGREVELLDARLGEAFEEGEVRKMVRIGLLCVQEESTKRPTMQKVVQMLDGDSYNNGELPSPPPMQNLHLVLEAHYKLMASSKTETTDEDDHDHDPLLAQPDPNSYTLDYSQLNSGR